jgi:hypothetical protein
MAKLQYEIDDRRLFFGVGVRTSFSGDIKAHLKGLGYDDIEIELINREYHKGCAFITANEPIIKRKRKQSKAEESVSTPNLAPVANNGAGFISPESLPTNPITGTVKNPVKTHGKVK